MTQLQVQTMIDEKLDFALADQLGWVNAWDGIRLVWLDGKTNEFCRKVTDWHPSTDPADSLEVQTTAIKVHEANYFANLLSVKQIPTSHSLIDAFRAIALASPRQRAEAAYMTLQAYQTKE